MKPISSFQTLSAVLVALLSLNACWESKSAPTSLEEINRNAEIILNKGEIIQAKLALTDEETTQGLSGIQDQDFQANQGMLFIYPKQRPLRFWMPDTYFDLDIYFLDASLKVIDIERNVEHHPGYDVPPAIATTRTILAQHVLELRSDSPLNQKIRIGDTLKLSAEVTLSQIIELMEESR